MMPAEPDSAKSWSLTRKVAAFAGFLAAVAALIDGGTALITKASLTCSLGISLPWCKAPMESTETRVLLNIVRASRSLEPVIGSQQGILTPISPEVMALLVKNYPREVVLYTVMSGINLTGSAGKSDLIYNFHNDPADDRYNGVATNEMCRDIIQNSHFDAPVYSDDSLCSFSKFSHFLKMALDYGLTSESLNSTGHICWNPNLARRDHRSDVLAMNNVCGDTAKASAKLNFSSSNSNIDFDFGNGVKFFIIRFECRSTKVIYEFLGKLLRDNSAARIPPSFTANGSQPELFMNVRRGENRDCLVSASFEKQSYCVPQIGSNNTLVLFNILEKL